VFNALVKKVRKGVQERPAVLTFVILILTMLKITRLYFLLYFWSFLSGGYFCDVTRSFPSLRRGNVRFSVTFTESDFGYNSSLNQLLNKDPKPLKELRDEPEKFSLNSSFVNLLYTLVASAIFDAIDIIDIAWGNRILLLYYKLCSSKYV